MKRKIASIGFLSFGFWMDPSVREFKNDLKTPRYEMTAMDEQPYFEFPSTKTETKN